ncbi:hypothetical protein DNTS_032386 [Danionella cerebrum]|uniref:G-protein coupled receptors family 1 profile domain-containing protein n=1 Tax=Danionella cerebrum TaxID=2873325 RepID=A0A553PX00_9TELE|nr:hypothetical protein DNTS_032386 [Danionella translucida]
MIDKRSGAGTQCLNRPGDDTVDPVSGAPPGLLVFPLDLPAQIRIVSLISLAVLSYERYCTMMGSTEADATNYRKVIGGVLMSWVYSLIWTLPPLFGWSRYGPEGPGTTCSVDWTSKTANNISYIVCLFIFCLVAPFFVIVFCYGRLLHAIKQPLQFEELLEVVTRAVEKLDISWPPAAQAPRSESKLDELYLRPRSQPPRQGLPFFRTFTPRFQEARTQSAAFQRFLPRRRRSRSNAGREQTPAATSGYRETQKQSVATRAPPEGRRHRPRPKEMADLRTVIFNKRAAAKRS